MGGLWVLAAVQTAAGLQNGTALPGVGLTQRVHLGVLNLQAYVPLEECGKFDTACIEREEERKNKYERTQLPPPIFDTTDCGSLKHPDPLHVGGYSPELFPIEERKACCRAIMFQVDKENKWGLFTKNTGESNYREIHSIVWVKDVYTYNSYVEGDWLLLKTSVKLGVNTTATIGDFSRWAGQAMMGNLATPPSDLAIWLPFKGDQPQTLKVSVSIPDDIVKLPHEGCLRGDKLTVTFNIRKTPPPSADTPSKAWCADCTTVEDPFVSNNASQIPLRWAVPTNLQREGEAPTYIIRGGPALDGVSVKEYYLNGKMPPVAKNVTARDFNVTKINGAPLGKDIAYGFIVAVYNASKEDDDQGPFSLISDLMFSAKSPPPPKEEPAEMLQEAGKQAIAHQSFAVLQP